uniref:WD_REPEATS_REGION domain-containing protein n=1 Tax=Syphacia muris TaxID=451379 RepID=A0A0N5AP20_9BILA
MASAEERKVELERKKQKLAEIREDRRRREEQRRLNMLRNSQQENSSVTELRPSMSQKDLDMYLESIGIPSQPRVERPSTPHSTDGTQRSTDTTASSCARSRGLALSEVQMTSVVPKDYASYCKTTQTDDDRVSGGEFSLGSQEFDFEDELGIMDKHLDINLDESPTRQIATLFPNLRLNMRQQQELPDEKEESRRAPDLSEEEKLQILSSEKFQQFFEFSSKIMERQLAEEVDVFIDYTRDATNDDKADNGQKLLLSRIFVDEKWSAGRCVTAIDYCEQHPELVVVSYDQCLDHPLAPMGVVQVWNTRFKKPTPEFTFYCQSRLTSVAFAKFHPNLILGGCYSGQICMWDNRSHKKTPVNKSPLSSQAHTHPVFSMAVIGSQNAHNLVTISSDGKLCSWSIDNLAQPIDVNDLTWKQKAVACLCMSFLYNDVNNFIVGSEEGAVYTAARHGDKSGIIESFEGHMAPVTGVDSHNSTSLVDLSHLFLTCSLDWTIKLWSSKDPKPICVFEKHDDYVMDVAWSPTHPAVFASGDVSGNLFLWNLNERTDNPIARLETKDKVGIRKLLWTQNGQQLAVGDMKGNLYLYDVHESITNVKAEEWTNFTRTLRDIKEAAKEADKLSETNSKIGSSASSTALGSLQGLSNTTPLSPRQQW